MKTVGVLGGMGPEATVLFMQRVLEAVNAKDDADHIPLLVDQNSQVPSRIKAILDGEGQDPAPVIARMAERLTSAGAQALAMPCNTAHHFAPAIEKASSVPFFNMVAMAADHAASLAPNGSVGLLGSPALAQVRLYDAPLAAHGLSMTPLQDPDAMLTTIRQIKAHGPKQSAKQALIKEVAAQQAAGADCICICCTEFSLASGLLPSDLPIFDALDLLVQATVKFARGDMPHPAAETN